MHKSEGTPNGCTAWTRYTSLQCVSDSSLICARQNAEMFLKLTIVVHDDDSIIEQALMGTAPFQDVSRAMAAPAERWVLCDDLDPSAEAYSSHELHAAPPTACEQPYQLGNNAKDSKRDADSDSWAPGAEAMHHSTAGLAAAAGHHKHSRTPSQDHNLHVYVPTLFYASYTLY